MREAGKDLIFVCESIERVSVRVQSVFRVSVLQGCVVNGCVLKGSVLRGCVPPLNQLCHNA